MSTFLLDYCVINHCCYEKFFANRFCWILLIASLDLAAGDCILGDNSFPEGCQQCTGQMFINPYQMTVCTNGYINYFPCKVGTQCVPSNNTCKASCKVVDKRVCILRVCVGNNCTYIEKEDGCKFCNGAWQYEKTNLVVCRGGNAQEMAYPGNMRCLGSEECSAGCRNPTNNTYIGTGQSRIAPYVSQSSSHTWIIYLIIGIAFVILLISLIGLCWYFRKRISHRVQKIRTFSHFTKKVRTHPVPELPNMSSLQLITLNQLIIDRSQKLGAGEFGVVYAGKLLLDGLLGKKFPVAIKVINPSTNLIPNVEQEMLKESAIMAQLNHKHLLKLVGICLANGIKIVTLLRPLGSLDKFLCTKKNLLGPRELVTYCFQIASAMEYLSCHKIIHRDLATRNVLLKHYYHVEVSDFGLSSLLEGEERSPQKLPFRWLPIECLLDLRSELYCEASDVWAYGVTCWEILTFGKIPYFDLRFEQKMVLQTMYNFLSEGNRLEKPENCGLELYQLMIMCWSQQPLSRQKFTKIRETLERLKKNPFAYVSDNRNPNSSLKTSKESAENQINLIAEILGEDDYLYEDYLMKNKNENDAVEIDSDDYFEDKKKIKKSLSAINGQGYITKDKNKNLHLPKSNSYTELVDYTPHNK